MEPSRTPSSRSPLTSASTPQPAGMPSVSEQPPPASSPRQMAAGRSASTVKAATDKTPGKKSKKTKESKPSRKDGGAARSPEEAHSKEAAEQLGNKTTESRDPKPSQKEADEAEIAQSQHPEEPAEDLHDLPGAEAKESANEKSNKPPATSADEKPQLMKKRGSTFTDFIGKLITTVKSSSKARKQKNEENTRSRQQLDSKGLHDLLASNPSMNATPARPVTALSVSPAGSGHSIQQGTYVIIGTALVILVTSAVVLVPQLFAETGCQTAVCRYYAGLLNELLNDSVSPCVDFHAHVCARWETTETEPVRGRVYREFVRRVSEAVSTSAVPPQGQTAAQKAAQFYQSCRNIFKGKRSELQLVKERLLEFGVFWPEMSNKSRLVRTLVSLSAAWNWGSVIQLYTWKTGRFTVGPTIIFGLTLLRRAAMLSPTTGQSSYKQYFDKMVDAFRHDDGRVISYEELIDLESKLLPLIIEPFVSTTSTTLPKAGLDELEEVTLGIIPKATWKQELQTYFNITTDPVFDIVNVELVKAFFNLVKNVGEKKMMYYVGWAVVQAASLFSNAELVRYFFQTEGFADYGHQEICFETGQLYMGMSLFAMYVRTSVTPAVLQDVSALLRTVQRSLRQRLEGALTLDWNKLVSLVPVFNESESVILSLVSGASDEQLDKLYARFPDMTKSVITNLELATRGRRATAEDTHVPLFDAHDNFFTLDGRSERKSFRLFPMAFEPPGYHEHAPLGVKYGALGGEIVYGFVWLLQAALQDVDAETRSKLESNASCGLGGNGTVSPEALKLGLSAMFVSKLYETFYHLKDNAFSLNVGNRKRVTETQLFFILWCYMQCGARNAKAECNDLLKGLSHFHHVFGCSRGSGMFPGQLCA